MKHLPANDGSPLRMCEKSVLEKDACPVCVAEHRGQTLRSLVPHAIALVGVRPQDVGDDVYQACKAILKILGDA